jgi:hypothetical protein
MSATQTKKHACSCGRSFANEQILKYHQRVSKHTSDEAASSPQVIPVEAPVEEAVLAEEILVAPAPAQPLQETAFLAAIEVLRAKRAELEIDEWSGAASNQTVDEFVEFAGEVAVEAARVGKRAVTSGLSAAYQVFTKVVVLLVVILLTASLFTAGVGLVNLVASNGAPLIGGHGAWTTVARI